MTTNNSLKHFGILGMRWGHRKSNSGRSVGSRMGNHFDRSAKQKFGVENATAKISQKAKDLKAMGKKKYNELPQRKKDGLKILAIMAGTAVTTVALAKGSDLMVKALQKKEYEDAIQSIADVIITNIEKTR